MLPRIWNTVPDTRLYLKNTSKVFSGVFGLDIFECTSLGQRSLKSILSQEIDRLLGDLSGVLFIYTGPIWFDCCVIPGPCYETCPASITDASKASPETQKSLA